MEQVKELSKEVEAVPPREKQTPTQDVPRKEANARMIELGLTPVSSGLDLSYYQNISQVDPLLALAGLRIELETLTRNLARGFKIQAPPSETVRNLLIRLENKGAITGSQMQLAIRILGVCNRAIHGEPISQREAEDVIKAAEVVYRDYLAWLSWGFPDNWKPSNPS